MNAIITGTVTYEVFNCETIEEAVGYFQNVVIKSNAMDMKFIAIRDLFATEMNDDGTFNSDPKIWDFDDTENV